MVYYILLFILILLLSSMGGGRAQRNKNLLFIVSAFFFFFAFRIGFTPDYYNYELGFMPLHNNMSIDVDGRTEIGYQWLCRIMPSYRFVLILFTLFFSVCMYIVFKDYIKTQYWPLAFTILFCVTPFVLGNMSGMRSGFVTCFFFLALIAKQKFKKEGLIIALGLIMAAYLFHRSALALAPLLIISGKPLGKFANYAVIILFGLIVYFAFRYANEINMLTLNFAHNVLERREYDTYFEEDTAYAFNLNGVIKIILLSVLAFLTLKSSNEEKDRNRNLMMKYAAILYMIMILPNGIIGRYYYYFAFPCVIGTVYVVEKAKNDKRLLFLSLLGLYLFWQIYIFYRGDMVYFTAYDNILTPW